MTINGMVKTSTFRSGQSLGWNIALPTTQAGWSRPAVNHGQFSSFYHPTGSGAVVSTSTGFPVSGTTNLRLWLKTDVVWPESETIEMTWTGSPAGTIDSNSSPYTYVVPAATDDNNFVCSGEISNFVLKKQGDSGTYNASITSTLTYGECIRWMEAMRINEDGGTEGAVYDSTHPYVRVRDTGTNEFYHNLPRPDGFIYELSNTFNMDCWVCFHHRATQQNVTDFVNDLVNAGFTGKLYVEWSNEVWNGGFPQNDYFENNHGYTIGGAGNPAGVTAAAQAHYADKADECAETAKAAYANTVGVIASQTASPSLRNHWFSYTGSRAGSFIDAYAISWYAGGVPSRALSQAQALAKTADTLATLVRDDWTTSITPNITTWKTNADTDSKDLLFYEGGSHCDNSDSVAQAHLADLSNSYAVGAVHGEMLDWIRVNVGADALVMAFQDVGDPDDPWSWREGELGPLTTRNSMFNQRST